ncbi:pleckstrin homology domain-containing family G member 3-like isoform X2 [Myripristis murdjan]|uniref:pleckstrin homology domain-containing family G member 3-like isoform X2 n=1 Tax=Myripristis murdjan TaxID=586833 RepID=UPI00117649AD|nr:pleckstrin homology domain-containing family G member 3-like isoform X2 [Myripristis murdjan]XP_029902570.1 pleckstrin homology domain-containing family G member 3-like isoform X2 [Myripristis murdjan]
MPEGSHSAAGDEPRAPESPRLSAASIGSNERAPSATPSDGSDLPSHSRRPLSLISTLSSGSASSRDDIAVPPSNRTSDPDVDLDLSPAGGAAEAERAQPHPDTRDPVGKGRGLGLCHRQNNNNNSASTPSRAASRRQASASPFAAKTMSPNPQLSYLDRVVMEIIETERMYVRDLRMIVEDYLAHIIDQSDLSIRPEQVCALFGNIEDIYEFNSELLQDLDLCHHDPVAIARCFVMKSEYFEIYTQYCTNYPNSVAALTECMRIKSLAKFFRERQASLKRSLPLGSYLLKPVQRILKYHLLLQEIAKHFDPQEEGYEVVEEAIYTMTGVAWYINDMKRKHEHAVRLQEVQSLLLNWKGPDLTTYGELVLEGTFKVHRAKNERTLFLFDRMLLITKRRGEHYVYKAHISCSTLMLIESAKDSLSFSVTHYKHPKQPHTVQAKTVEEKKLWAHHIKRIILENHHAIIPQKAKEAILEMDSMYSSRYRYSPERLKKALSCQSDEFPREGRQGRRQSEPTKQILRSTKAILKHADSEGALPGERRSLQSAPSISTLGSSLGESEAERPSVEEEEDEEEEEEEEPGGRKDSLELLSGSDEEARPEPPRSQRAGPTAAEQEESDSEDILMEDDQDEEGILEPGCKQQNGQLAGQDEPSGNEEPPTEKLQQEATSEAKPSESPEAEAPSIPKSPSATPPSRLPVSPHREEAQTPEGGAKNPEEPSATTPESDSKTLSSGESSDEEDEKEAAEKESEADSILPTSVLDKASAIAQHFSNSIRRSSLATDDSRSLGCPSPRLPSRNASSLSLGAEVSERSLRLNSACSEPQETFGVTDLSALSPREDSLFDGDRSIRRRRDSTLSKQDQLLIGKIKSYYENAENEDATFSLRRRESLTYIPSGLVRNSVSRFNSIPKDEASPAEKNLETVQMNPSTESDLASAAGAEGHIVSSASFDSLKTNVELEDLGFNKGGSTNSAGIKSTSQSLQEMPVKDEEFRPSSEMIKIWQAMERDIGRSQGREKPPEALRNSKATALSLSNRNNTPSKDSDREGEESDLSTITEESMSPSPMKHKGLAANRTGSWKGAPKMFREEGAVLRATFPRIAQLKAEADGAPTSENSDQPDSADKAKTKVLHLARQYSQRIKTGRPVVRQRSQDVLMGKKSLPCVIEEKESSGKPSLTLPLVSSNQVAVERVRSPSPTHPCRSAGSPGVVSPGQAHARSPLSPPPAEGFNWPDVRELRSKYAVSDSDRSQQLPVGRSRSVPERMLDGGTKRRSSCSSSLLLGDGGSGEVPQYRPHLGQGTEQGESSARLHRANSLDHRLSSLHLGRLQRLHHELPDSHHAAVPGLPPHDAEKLPESEPEPEEAAKEAKEAAKEDKDDSNYVQIRSPTSREKISIMAVIDRCRAYQESDEYRQREEARARAEPNLPAVRARELDRAAAAAAATAAATATATATATTTVSSNEQEDEAQETSVESEQKAEAGQQSLVKNLREKFQNLR